MKRSELINTVISWNNRFPLDRWWRAKHNIPFMSQAHRESTFINQLMEFEEDRLFGEILNDIEQKDKYIPGSGDIFKSSDKMEDFISEAEMEVQNMLKVEEDGRE